jgi:predicted dehydrogenase
MAKLTAAVIGCGHMGWYHLSALHAMDEIQLVAACDMVPELVNKRAEEFEMPKRYTDMHAMLEEVKPDIVVVATQVRQHRETVLDCAGARVKGVLCEKPMAIDLTQCDEMVEACRKNGTQLAINHQLHCSPSTRLAQTMIANGEIGELIVVRGLNKGRRKAGNELIHQATHTADRMTCFGGRAMWCQAFITAEGRSGVTREANAGDIMQSKELDATQHDAGLVMGYRIFAHYGFTDCSLGEMYCMAWEQGSTHGVDLIGSKGHLHLGGGLKDKTVYFLDRATLRGSVEDQWQRIEPSFPHVWNSANDLICLMHLDLIRAIETGEEHPSSGEAGRHAMEMLMAIYESHRHKARVELPLQERRHPLERWREAMQITADGDS